MEVNYNTLVKVSYILRKSSEHGEILEAINKEKPVQSIIGNGKLIPEFESKLIGLQKGAKFQFALDGREIFGKRDVDAVIRVPIEAFKMNDEVRYDLIKLNNPITMLDNAGRRIKGTIIDILENHVEVDFNHPLADETLYFSGEIHDIHIPTEEEILQLEEHSCECGGNCDCNTSSSHEACECADTGCGCH